MAGDSVIPVRMLALENAQDDLRDSFNEIRVQSRIFPVYIPNRLILGKPAAAATATASGTGVTENRAWVYTYGSTEGDFETAISSPVTKNLANEQAWLSGARSIDTRIDLVNIYTQLNGANVDTFRRVTQIANPSSGSWNYTDGNSYASYLGQPAPCVFAYPLQIACGTGFKLRKIKLQSSRTLSANSTAYWKFWLELRKNNTNLAYRIVGMQDTKAVGLQAANVYRLPMFHVNGDNPNPDLDLPLNEDDRVYFMSRGVGAVSPLPNLTGMVEVTRETP